MKTVTYTTSALRDLKRHGNMTARVRAALVGYAESTGAHTNNMTQLARSTAMRLRVGDFWVIFEEFDTTIVVTKIGPRGGVYDCKEIAMTTNDTITLSRQEYEDLVDARDHAIAMREVASGAMETIPDAEVDDYLAALSPLAFWRKRRGMIQKTLADASGISQSYLAQIEHGKRNGSVKLYVAFAKALNVGIANILPE